MAKDKKRKSGGMDNRAGFAGVEKKKKRMKQFFRQLHMLYGALLAGQMIFAVVVLVVSGLPTKLGSLSFEDPFLLFGVVVTFMSIFVAWWINDQRKAQGARLADIMEKTGHYRNLVIMRCAMVEGANLMALTFALASRQGFFFLLFSAGLTAFAYFRPSKQEFARDYNLRPDEEGFLEE